MTIEAHWLATKKEIVPTKRESTQRREGCRIREINAYFGDYSLAAVTPDLVARFRDMRLGAGKSTIPCVWNSPCLATLFTVAIWEWHIGLTYNPVANIQAQPGRGPRPTPDTRRTGKSAGGSRRPFQPHAWLDHPHRYRNRHAPFGNTQLATQPSRPEPPHSQTHRKQNGDARTGAAHTARNRYVPQSTEQSSPPNRHRPDFLWRTRQKRQTRPYCFNRIWIEIKTSWAFRTCVSRSAS